MVILAKIRVLTTFRMKRSEIFRGCLFHQNMDLTQEQISLKFLSTFSIFVNVGNARTRNATIFYKEHQYVRNGLEHSLKIC